MQQRIAKSQKTANHLIHKEKQSSLKTKNTASNTHPEISIIHWLGGTTHVKQEIHSDFDLIKVSMAGITKASIDALTQYLGISKKNMAEGVLDLSVKTLERKEPNDILDKKTSSHALEIAKVLQHAFEVFEDEQKVKQWLNRGNRALNGSTPVQLLNTLTGINMVNDILTRIEEGIYS